MIVVMKACSAAWHCLGSEAAVCNQGRSSRPGSTSRVLDCWHSPCIVLQSDEMEQPPVQPKPAATDPSALAIHVQVIANHRHTAQGEGSEQ